MTQQDARSGIVYLVGGGPGDPGLLTVRGAEVLRRADVVVHDGLANPDLLRWAPADARRIAVGRRSGHREVSQEGVNALLVEEARAGLCVVRLKGGDPCVFGRVAEEAEALADAGVAFEIVPGVSSFHAVPAYAGIPVAAAEGGCVLTVLAGQENPEKSAPAIDWRQVARTPGTKVLLMALHNLRGIAGEMMSAGLPGATPVAVIRRGTTTGQETLVGTLDRIAEDVAHRGFTAPAVVVIGDVVAVRESLAWFERRPLLGRRVVLTRATGRAGATATLFRDQGAEVWEIPTIRQEPPSDGAPFDLAVAEAGSYDWIVFTSAAGVDAFVDRLLAVHGDLRAFGGARLAAVGPATAARLAELHLRVDVTPAEGLGREVAAAMKRDGDLENLRVLLARAEVANPDLPKALEAQGAMVDDVAVYRTVPETQDPEGLGARLIEEGADWLAFTSGSTAVNFDARFGLKALLARHPRLRVASIGPETSKAIRGLDAGIPVAVEAKSHTTDGLLAAIIEAATVDP